MSSRVEIRSAFNDALIALGKPTVTKSEIKQICKNLGISGAQWFTKVDSNRVGRGLYKVPTTTTPASATIQMAAQILPMKKQEIGRAHV